MAKYEQVEFLYETIQTKVKIIEVRLGFRYFFILALLLNHKMLKKTSEVNLKANDDWY